MPGDPYKKVAAGQRLDIRAVAWNRLMDLVRSQDLADAGGGPVTLDRNPNLVKVRNDSGAARARFDVLALEAPLIGPHDNLAEFQRVVSFSGVVPRVPAHYGRFCVLQEPLAKGAIGRGQVAGVTPCRLLVPDVVTSFADVADGDCARLESLDQGSAQVLWSDPGGPWAVVRLGNLDEMPSGSGSGTGAAAGKTGCTSYEVLVWLTCDGGPVLTTRWFNIPGGSGITVTSAPLCASKVPGSPDQFITHGGPP